ncbi:MAG: hypothetical protein EP330_21140 [Deltaproteobacteria bacterium]|nr:MAG: hypothetical protein EP330_21140 [Deltaproteobacteria bacterium]
MAPSRRTFLKYGLAGTALLAAGGVGLGLRPTTYREPRTPLKALTPRQFSVLAAVADRISPAHGDLPSAWEVEVPEKVDALLARKAPADAEEFGLVLDLLENALVGLVLDQRFTTFTGSSPEVQDAVLRGMRTSSLATRRTMFTALRGLCSASYWSDLRVSQHLGYVRPNYGNVGVPAPIEATPPAEPETVEEAP